MSGIASATINYLLKVSVNTSLPVVAHKTVAEVSKIGHYRRGELWRCMDIRANPLVDRKVAGAVLVGMFAVLTSTKTARCSVA